MFLSARHSQESNGNGAGNSIREISAEVFIYLSELEEEEDIFVLRTLRQERGRNQFPHSHAASLFSMRKFILSGENDAVKLSREREQY